MEATAGVAVGSITVPVPEVAGREIQRARVAGIGASYPPSNQRVRAVSRASFSPLAGLSQVLLIPDSIRGD